MDSNALTTLSKLLVALGQAIKQSGKELKISEKKIQNYYLLNNDEDDELRYKLMLTHSDKESLIRLVEGTDLPSTASQRIVENYQFFIKKIQETNINLETLYDGIAKLIIVDVSLDRTQDNPQLIFESMNSTGLELSQADLIRNFILMGLEPKEQNDLYHLFRVPMELIFWFGRKFFDYFALFLRYYLILPFVVCLPRFLCRLTCQFNPVFLHIR